MLINFPNQLTSEEEQLLKKIAKMKKKKKNYSEKKAQIKETEASTSTVTAAAAALKLKRTNSGNYAGTQLDAKEQAKKLVQSGLIKLETENKEKGFKRSCSRKDDSKKTQLNLTSDALDPNRPVTYSSINSPNSAKSPNVSSPYFGSNNKFSFSDNQSQHSPSYNNNFNNNRGGGGGGGYRKNNSFQNNYNNQDNRNNFRFQTQRQNSQQHQQQQQQGVSLFVKANNVTEELLRSIFSANVPTAKVLSIDIKTNFAFVSVDSSESANNAILELNGKTFQDNLYSVSLARPRKTFNRNNTYNSNYDRSNSNPNNNNNNNNNSANFNTNQSTSSPSKNTNDPNRQIINYEDI